MGKRKARKNRTEGGREREELLREGGIEGGRDNTLCRSHGENHELQF